MWRLNQWIASVPHFKTKSGSSFSRMFNNLSSSKQTFSFGAFPLESFHVFAAIIWQLNLLSSHKTKAGKVFLCHFSYRNSHEAMLIKTGIWWIFSQKLFLKVINHFTIFLRVFISVSDIKKYIFLVQQN